MPVRVATPSDLPTLERLIQTRPMSWSGSSRSAIGSMPKGIRAYQAKGTFLLLEENGDPIRLGICGITW